MAGNYILGISLGLTSTLLSALGLTAQKKSHLRNALLPKAEQTVPLKRPLYLSGLGLMVAGAVLSIFVFDLIGQSESSALGAMTMVYNTYLAWKFLNERLTKVDIIATVLMVTGTIIAVVFRGVSGAEDIDYTLDRILHMFDRVTVYVASAVFGAIFIGGAWYLRSIAGESVHDMPAGKWFFVCFLRSFLGGLYSGPTGTLTKSLVEIVTNSFGRDDFSDFARWEFYFFLVGLPLSLFLQIRYLTSAQQLFDNMLVVPIYQSMIVLAGIAFGYIYFDETSGASALSLVMFGLGCAITIAGISFLLVKATTGNDRRGPRPASAAAAAAAAATSEADDVGAATPSDAAGDGVGHQLDPPSGSDSDLGDDDDGGAGAVAAGTRASTHARRSRSIEMEGTTTTQRGRPAPLAVLTQDHRDDHDDHHDVRTPISPFAQAAAGKSTTGGLGSGYGTALDTTSSGGGRSGGGSGGGGRRPSSSLASEFAPVSPAHGPTSPSATDSSVPRLRGRSTASPSLGPSAPRASRGSIGGTRANSQVSRDGTNDSTIATLRAVAEHASEPSDAVSIPVDAARSTTTNPQRRGSSSSSSSSSPGTVPPLALEAAASSARPPYHLPPIDAQGRGSVGTAAASSTSGSPARAPRTSILEDAYGATSAALHLAPAPLLTMETPPGVTADSRTHSDAPLIDGANEPAGAAPEAADTQSVFDRMRAHSDSRVRSSSFVPDLMLGLPFAPEGSEASGSSAVPDTEVEVEPAPVQVQAHAHAHAAPPAHEGHGHGTRRRSERRGGRLVSPAPHTESAEPANEGNLEVTDVPTARSDASARD